MLSGEIAVVMWFICGGVVVWVYGYVNFFVVPYGVVLWVAKVPKATSGSDTLDPTGRGTCVPLHPC